MGLAESVGGWMGEACGRRLANRTTNARMARCRDVSRQVGNGGIRVVKKDEGCEMKSNRRESELLKIKTELANPSGSV